MYLGNKPATDQTYLSLKSQQITGTGVATYSLDYDVSSPEDLAVFINEVRQNVNTYTIDNQQITLGGNVTSSDTCYIVYLSRAVGSIAPQDNSVGTSKIIDASITSAKLASGVLPTNTPSFRAYRNGSQSMSSSWTKVQINTEVFDTDSAFDNSTNYRFTVPSGKAGKYFFSGTVKFNNVPNAVRIGAGIYVNGSINSHQLISVGGTEDHSQSVNCIVNLSESDYVELHAYHNHTSSISFNGSSDNTWFQGFKLI